MAERQHTPEKARRRFKSVKRAGLVADPIKAAKIMEKHTAGKSRSRPKSVKASVFPADPIEKLKKDTHEFIASAEPRGTFESLRKDQERFGKDQERRTQVFVSFESSSQGIESSLQEISDLLGGHRILGSTVKSELDAHALLHRGLPEGAVTSLVQKLHDIPVIVVSEALGVSLRTLQRHKSAPVALLDVQQSGRAWKFAEILAKATRALGSQEEAEQWLKRPAIGLDQQRPVDLLTTPAGVKLVEDYLGRLECDVYT
jgi:putative toxin-antitoxin system antitoxin component (TIGR02293 family)